jgi:Fe-S cluster biogenesis protein NfuA
MLFNMPFVKQVFFDENYISVTKIKEIEWAEIQVELRNQIQDFLSSGQEAVDTKNQSPGSSSSNTEQETPAAVEVHPSAETELGKNIISILEEYVKPAVASDGGNIQFEKYEPETKTVFVLLQGACAGCPSSTFTLKNGIETMLKNMLGDQIQQVVATNG